MFARLSQGEISCPSVAVAPIGVNTSIIQFGVRLVVVKRSGVVHVQGCIPLPTHSLPSVSTTHRESQSLVSFQHVAWVALGIKPVGTQIERPSLPVPFKTFRHMQELTLHVGFETSSQVVPPSAALYLY